VADVRPALPASGVRHAPVHTRHRWQTSIMLYQPSALDTLRLVHAARCQTCHSVPASTRLRCQTRSHACPQRCQTLRHRPPSVADVRPAPSACWLVSDASPSFTPLGVRHAPPASGGRRAPRFTSQRGQAHSRPHPPSVSDTSPSFMPTRCQTRSHACPQRCQTLRRRPPSVADVRPASQRGQTLIPDIPPQIVCQTLSSH
jgi:hypothetical protein